MSVSLVIPPRERDLGDGMKVRRALPYVQKRMVGPFIFWDHMGPVKVSEAFEMLVRSHPHIGLSTLTYLLSGEILHRDTLGNELLMSVSVFLLRPKPPAIRTAVLTTEYRACYTLADSQKQWALAWARAACAIVRGHSEN